MRAVVVGLAIAAATFAIVGTLAAASQGDVTFPILWVERIGSLTTDLVRRVGRGLGFGAAFLAGTIAAFNPCGFALVPAYLGVYLDDRDTGSAPAARAVWVSAIVSLAFSRSSAS